MSSGVAFFDCFPVGEVGTRADTFACIPDV